MSLKDNDSLILRNRGTQPLKVKVLLRIICRNKVFNSNKLLILCYFPGEATSPGFRGFVVFEHFLHLQEILIENTLKGEFVNMFLNYTIQNKWEKIQL